MFLVQLIIKLLILFGWINNLYFGYRAIKYDYNFDQIISDITKFYFSGDYHGFWYGSLEVVLGIMIMLIMGWSLIGLFIAIWNFLKTKLPE